MEKLKEEIEASKSVKDKQVIDKFQLRAYYEISQNYETLKKLTNRACAALPVEEEEYKHVVNLKKEFRELEEFYKKISKYTYYLTNSIYGGVMQEWFDKNCEFGDGCYYLDHLISEREDIKNGLINIDRID